MNFSTFAILLIFMHLFALNFTNFNDGNDEEILYEKWQLPKPKLESNSIESAIRKYFEPRTKILNVRIHLDVVENNWKSDFTDNLVDALTNSTELTFNINVQNSNRRSRLLFYNNLYYVDSFESLNASLPIFHGDRGNFAGNYIILMRISNEDELNYEEEIKIIFENLFKIDIINVNIVVMNSTDGPHPLYSYEVFQAENCRETIPKIVNYFENGKFRERELFPQKLRNFNQCYVRLLSRNVPPFFNYDRSERKNNSVTVYGFESELIEVVAAHLNFTPILHIFPKDLWGAVYENGTITGPFAALEFQMVDLLMGFFSYEPQRMRYFGQTQPYLLSPVIAVVNRKRKTIKISSTWFLDPYGSGTWLLLIFTLLAAFALLGLAYQTKLFREIHCEGVNGKFPTWLEALGNALGNCCTIPDGDGRTILRLCIITWAMGFIICNAAYAGKLFVAYNRFEINKPMKLEDLKHKNYTFLVRETFSGEQLLEEVLGVGPERIVRIATNDANEIYDMMVNHTDKVATLATDLRVMYYMIKRDYYDLLYTLSEILRMRQICAYFRSHSYLIQPFDDIIGKLSDFGLLSKWYHDTENSLTKDYYRLRDTRLSTEAKPLTFSTFRRVFYGYMLFLLFATFSLLFELGFYKLSPKLLARPRRLRVKAKKHPQ